MPVLFRPGSHWTRWCFSSLGCMNRFPIHSIQGLGSRVATQDMAGAWLWRSISHVLPVIATWSKVQVPELIQTSWTPPGHGLPEEWVTSKLCPKRDNSMRLHSGCLRVCQYYTKSYCVTWDRPEYLCTSPRQSQRQTGILPQVQSQHSLTLASSFSSTRLFCASLRVSKHHPYQHTHEKETEISSKTVVQELFNYDPLLIFASVKLHNA